MTNNWDTFKVSDWRGEKCIDFEDSGCGCCGDSRTYIYGDPEVIPELEAHRLQLEEKIKLIDALLEEIRATKTV